MDINKLISLVKVRSALWNQGDSGHHNRYVLDKLWGEVAQELNSTSDAVRNRWKSLRDGFRKELKKVPTGRSGEAGSAFSDYSTWPHFRRMYFLKDQFASRPASGDQPRKKNKSLRDDQAETRDGELESSQLNLPDGRSVDILDVKVEALDSLNSYEQQAASNIESYTTQHGTKRLYPSDFDSRPAEPERPNLKVSEDDCKTTKDEDTSFFESLLPHIKRLAPARKMLLRMKIQELIYNFVYNQEF